MRCPAMMPGSGTNVSFGTCRMRIWRPTRPRRCDAAGAQRVAGVRRPNRRRRVGGRGGERRVVHLRVREVAGDVDTGERDQLEPRIRHALELVGEHLEHHLVDPRGARVLPLRAHGCSNHPVSMSISSTSGAAHDEPLDRGEHFAHLGHAAPDHRDSDRRPLPLVLVIDLGDRDREPVPQPVDDRTDRGALGLERSTLGNVEIEASGRSVHGRSLARQFRHRRFGCQPRGSSTSSPATIAGMPTITPTREYSRAVTCTPDARADACHSSPASDPVITSIGPGVEPEQQRPHARLCA